MCDHSIYILYLDFQISGISKAKGLTVNPQ